MHASRNESQRLVVSRYSERGSGGVSLIGRAVIGSSQVP
jgi:hypothetical protein